MAAVAGTVRFTRPELRSGGALTDQLEQWRVQGRVATAVRNMRESLMQLEADEQELVRAVAEAKDLGVPLSTFDAPGTTE
jgi:hypothetical protein